MALDNALAVREADENQLRLMLALCHPSTGSDTHVALILKYLCGFSAQELAAAFLTSTETVNKRLARGKAQLRREGSLIPSEELAVSPDQLASMLQALYLLFNEGYHGNNPETPVRATLCEEAMRLVTLLLRASKLPLPAADALAALFCFHYSRIKGRMDADGALITLADQDRSLWDRDLIAAGLRHLAQSAVGPGASPYHLEAGIALQHCIAPSLDETDWPTILNLYETLLTLSPSPLLRLNIALAKAMSGGIAPALADLNELACEPTLQHGPFWHAARGRILGRAGQSAASADSFRKAAAQARNPAEADAFNRQAANA
jgi:predicted RNA polymerase sigma factor